MRKLALLLLAMALVVSMMQAQTLTFTFQNGQVIAGPKYQFEIWIKSSDGTSRMGSIIVYVNYDATAFGTNVFAGGKISVTKGAAFGSDYDENPTNDNTATRVAFSWMYQGGAGNGVVIPSTGNGILAYTVIMDVADTAGSSNLSFEQGLMGGEQYLDDESTVWPAVDATDILNESPLPIQLASFTAGLVQENNVVVLKWTTASEINNYGFEVEKSKDNQDNFKTIEGSFVKGNGTTTDPQSYTYTDIDVQPGTWYYRLKQIDLDNTVHYSEAITPSVTTGIAERPLPKEFGLDQNYPNPFNPSTVIEFALPRESRVTLEVYNLLGQRVQTLVDDMRPAGYHTVRFNATGLSSGIYFYRMRAGEDVSFLRKMLLMK